MPHRAVLVVVAWLCLTFVAAAQTLTFPALTGRVVDEAGLLDPTDRAALTASLADLEARTGDQMVIVTLKSLQGTAIEDYGYQLGRHWGIGQKDRDSGVLLIVAASEHQARFEVGYGLEGVLTDAATKIILENSVLPRFKAGDYSGGIRAGTARIITLLVADAGASGTTVAANVPVGSRQTHGTVPVPFIIVLVLFGGGLLILCAVTTGGGLCRFIVQVLFMMLLSGRSNSSEGKSSFSGGGGSFGGGGSSGSW